MDNRAIGVFDSGLGGLTAVHALRQLLPQEDVVYFGDTGRIPYGTRSAETIIKYAGQDLRFLMGHRLKCVVVACGTVSSVALPNLQRMTDLPVLGVIRSTVDAAIQATKNGRIGVIGTNATIRSQTYQNGLAAGDAALTVFSKACPLLVSMVEDGRFRPGARVTEMLVEEYVTPLLRQGIDTLILGCTHYPLFYDLVSELLDYKVTLIDAGAAAAGEVQAALYELGLAAEEGRVGATRYLVTDSVDGFVEVADHFLQDKIAGSIEQVDIEEIENPPETERR